MHRIKELEHIKIAQLLMMLARGRISSQRTENIAIVLQEEVNLKTANSRTETANYQTRKETLNKSIDNSDGMCKYCKTTYT